MKRSSEAQQQNVICRSVWILLILRTRETHFLRQSGNTFFETIRKYPLTLEDSKELLFNLLSVIMTFCLCEKMSILYTYSYWSIIWHLTRHNVCYSVKNISAKQKRRTDEANEAKMLKCCIWVTYMRVHCIVSLL